MTARGLVLLGRAPRQLVQPAMDVGVVLGIEAHDRIEHGARFLGGSGVVEIGERVAVRFLGEQRELRADGGYVVSGRRINHRPGRKCRFLQS
jgi:hypothetical protein